MEKVCPSGTLLSPLSSQLSPGFGLLEVLVSGGILALIAGATVALASSSLRTSSYSANRTVALHLSQAGVEQVRQMRDTTFVDQSPNRWSELFPAACIGTASAPKACALRPIKRVPASGTGSSNSFELVPGDEPIQLATATGAVSFTRQTELRLIPWLSSADVGTTDLSSVLNDPTQTPALQVISRVSWPERSRTVTVESSTFLTDWRQVQ